MARKSNMSAESAAIVAYLRTHGPQTRQKLAQVVPTDTPGGLAKRLSNLRANGWVQREQTAGQPDLYCIQPSARGLFPELDAARHGKAAVTPLIAKPAHQPRLQTPLPEQRPTERYVPGPMAASDMPRMGCNRQGGQDFLNRPSRGVRC